MPARTHGQTNLRRGGKGPSFLQAAKHRLATRLLCPHTGVALAALNKLLDKGIIKKDQRIIVISTAHGLKFSRFKVKYHRQELNDVFEQYPNPPIELPANYDTVRRTIDEVGIRFNIV